MCIVLYWTEYSGRKVNTTHYKQLMCIVFVFDGIFRPELKPMQPQRQYLCIVFVLDGIFRPGSKSEQYMYIVFVFDGIFRPESWYNTTTMNVYCICIGRNIPAGNLIQNNNNEGVLYLFWTKYSGRKVTTNQTYCICIWRNIPAGK